MKANKSGGADYITPLLILVAALFSGLIFFSQRNYDEGARLILVILGILAGLMIVTMILAMKGKKRPRQVYLWYAEEDEPFVSKLYEAMKITPFKMIWDKKEIKVGDHIEKKTKQLLTDSDDVVVVVSRNSLPSQCSKPEIAKLLKLGKRILPILIDDAEPPDELKEIMFADFRQSFDDGYFSLRDALKADPQSEPVSPPAQAAPD